VNILKHISNGDALTHPFQISTTPPALLTTPPNTSILPSNNCKIPYFTYPLFLPCLSLSNPTETLCYSSSLISSLCPFPTLLTPLFLPIHFCFPHLSLPTPAPSLSLRLPILSLPQSCSFAHVLILFFHSPHFSPPHLIISPLLFPHRCHFPTHSSVTSLLLSCLMSLHHALSNCPVTF
jgi:hypothetical protein